MKSIANQYRDLKEGKMSQANFMRNLRMSLPQYITNVTSFDDSVKILKNKGIITELGPAALQMAGNPEEEASYRANLVKRPSEDEEDAELDAFIKKLEQDEEADDAIMSQHDLNESGVEINGKVVKNYKQNGDTSYSVEYEDGTKDIIYVNDDAWDTLKNADTQNLNEAKSKKKQEHEVNPIELRMGIKVEMEHTNDLNKAKKIALDHLSENPIYYTQLKLSGLDAHQEEVKKPKAAKKEKQKIEFVDKENGMKPVKDIEKIKASANKAHKETNKGVSGVQEFTHSAKRAKGIKQVMNPTGGKMKTVKEGFYIDQMDSDRIATLVSKMKSNGIKNNDIHNILVSKYGLSDQEANKMINPSSLGGGIDLGASFDKFKSNLDEIVRSVLAEEKKFEILDEIVREVLDEMYDGRDNLDAENEY
jgi:hypothetical protein